jgi:hypothetical protein
VFGARISHGADLSVWLHDADLQEQDGTYRSAPLRVIPGSHRDYTHVPEAESTGAHRRELCAGRFHLGCGPF